MYFICCLTGCQSTLPYSKLLPGGGTYTVGIERKGGEDGGVALLAREAVAVVRKHGAAGDLELNRFAQARTCSVVWCRHGAVLRTGSFISAIIRIRWEVAARTRAYY